MRRWLRRRCRRARRPRRVSGGRRPWWGSYCWAFLRWGMAASWRPESASSWASWSNSATAASVSPLAARSSENLPRSFFACGCDVEDGPGLLAEVLQCGGVRGVEFEEVEAVGEGRLLVGLEDLDEAFGVDGGVGEDGKDAFVGAACDLGMLLFLGAGELAEVLDGLVGEAFGEDGVGEEEIRGRCGRGRCGRVARGVPLRRWNCRRRWCDR
jgi:hypothetical protein